MPLEAEQTIQQDIVYDGKLFKVVRDQVRVSGGDVRYREIVQHPGAVALVAVDAAGRLLLVRQYRHAANRLLLEIPAGTREPGEDPEVCAQRELAEETGFRAAKLHRLGGFFSAPGFCTEYLHCYLMTELSETDSRSEEDEDIELVHMTREEAIAAIADGEITDAKTIAGVLMWAVLNTERA